MSEKASIENEYKKDKNLKWRDVEILKGWLKKQPHLPHLSELQLIIFFQSCYLNTEATKNAIENCFTIKTHCPEIFSVKTKSDLKKMSEVLLFTILPDKTPEGYDIFFGKLLDINPTNFDYNSVFILFDMVTCLHNYQKGSSTGHVIVFDSSGFQLGHMLKINLSLTKKFIFYLQEGMPVRLKSVHLINSFSLVDTALSMVKPFMKQSLINLMNVHTTMDSFYQHMSKDSLPEECQGTNSNIPKLKEQLQTNLLENLPFFVEEGKLVVDESKRVEKSKILEELFDVGVQGSFRKLDFD